ncbi:MAG: hypothetical protein AAFO07_19965, partial [Bacteroidota bacterium]
MDKSIAIPNQSVFSTQLQWRIIVPHIVFWLVSTFLIYQSTLVDGKIEHFWTYMGWLLPIDLATVYFTAY